MTRVIEITEKKINKLSSLVEDMLLAGGELMHCISKMEDEFYGERRGYDGGRYGNRMPMNVSMRGDDYDRDMDEGDEIRHMINERRRRRGGMY
jgi:hypothetical protein